MAEGCDRLRRFSHHRLPQLGGNVAEGRVAMSRPEVAEGAVDVPVAASSANGSLVRGQLRLHRGAVALGP
eukprot:4484262-Lingulodinium_polyedra.AAC.1